MYNALLVLTFVFCHGTALCQYKNTVNFKQWDENNHLQWKDFTITHQKKILSTGFLAEGVTSYQYSFLPSDWNTQSCINILTLFLKRESWVMDTLNSSLLEHEKIHFDIAELFARKLRKELFVLFCEKHKSHKTYSAKIESILTVAKDYQALYDEETFYGQIQSQQIIWNATIARELEQLEDYTFGNMHLKCKDYSR